MHPAFALFLGDRSLAHANDFPTAVNALIPKVVGNSLSRNLPYLSTGQGFGVELESAEIGREEDLSPRPHEGK